MPRGVVSTVLTGGLLLTGPRSAGVPVLPLPVLSARFARGLSEHLDLRVGYASVALVADRVGAEVRINLARSGGWSFALGVEPSALFYALPYQGAFLGGDLSTEVSALVTHRWSFAALTLEVGPMVQWMVFGQGQGRLLVDSRPHFAYLDVGARLEWARGVGHTMTVGLDLCIPLDSGDPLSFLGILPRVTVGWSWSR